MKPQHIEIRPTVAKPVSRLELPIKLSIALGK